MNTKNTLVSVLPFLLGLAACGGDSESTNDAAVAMDAGAIDAALAPDAAPGACPAPTGLGIVHSGFVDEDETWYAEDGPHTISFTVSVRRGATLTIEPCARVILEDGQGLVIGEFGGEEHARLVALGTEARPIRFEAESETTFGGSVRVLPTGSADLAHVTIHRGGNVTTEQNGGGALQIYGDDNRSIPLRSVRARHVRIEDSGGFGAHVLWSGGFTSDSEDLVVTNAGLQTRPSWLDTRYPVYAHVPSVQTIPPGDYADNAVPRILVDGAGPFDANETFTNRGVPYRLLGAMYLRPSMAASAGGLNVLTIERGVTILLSDGASIGLGSAAPTYEASQPVRLVAAGTAEEPIVFSSAKETPAAGDWGGIHWAAGAQAGNVLSYVRLEYGGADMQASGYGCGPRDNDALLLIRGWRPSEAFIQNCAFSNSAAGGIVSGWESDEPGPDLATTNTFEGIASGCNVSRPKSDEGVCPSEVTPACY